MCSHGSEQSYPKSKKRKQIKPLSFDIEFHFKKNDVDFVETVNCDFPISREKTQWRMKSLCYTVCRICTWLFGIRCASLLNSFFYIECFCTKMSFFFPSNSVIIFLNGRIFSSSNSKSKIEEDCWQQQFFAIFAKKSLLLAFTEILPCQSHVFKRDFFLKMKS